MTFVDPHMNGQSRSIHTSVGYAHRVNPSTAANVFVLSIATALPLSTKHEILDIAVLNCVKDSTSTAASLRQPPADVEMLEQQYRLLGRKAGSDSTRELRKQCHDWWTAQNAQTTEWLVRRIGSEIHWNTLHSVIDILIDAGLEGTRSAQRALALSVDNVDARLALFKVLINGRLDPSIEGDLKEIVTLGLSDPDLDVQEAASELAARIATDPSDSTLG